MSYKRIPILGKVLPVIAGAMAMAAVAVGAGIVGDNNVKVQEPLSIVAAFIDNVPANGVLYNDGLSASMTAETYPGGSYDLAVEFVNESDAEQDQRVTITAPDGFRFSAGSSQGSEITLTQESRNTFVLTVTENADGTGTKGYTVINIEVLPQVRPAWYTITFETEALETDLENVG